MLTAYKIKFLACFAPMEEANLFDAFKPMYIVLRLFGLLPYNMKFNKHKYHFDIIHKSLYFNSLCAIFNISLVLVFWILHIQYLTHSSEEASLKEALLTEMNYNVELLALQLVCVVSYLGTYINRTKYVKILNAIAKIQIRTCSYTKGNNYGRIRQGMFVRVIGGLIMALIIQLMINFTRADSLTKMILVTFSFILPQMIQFTLISQFYTTLQLVICVLRNINDILKISKTKRKSTDGISPFDSEIFLLTLRDLEVSYATVFEVVRDVNLAFETPILLTTAGCFHSIVSEAHIIYHGMVVEKMFQVHWILNCSVWIGWQLLKIYILSNSGETLKSEARKIAQSLYNIPTDKIDTRLLMEIQHFSAQIHYQNTELTVCGYFPLDSTLLYNVVAATAMYFVIFVQFDKTTGS